MLWEIADDRRTLIVASKVDEAPASEAAVTAAEVKPAGKAKAAFTLRLDAKRHLKLRLACAVNGRSAQQLVTDALDHLLVFHTLSKRSSVPAGRSTSPRSSRDRALSPCSST